MTLSSKEIAEKLGKRHDNLLRAIRKYVETLGEDAGEYFTAVGSGRKSYYECTMAGCEILGRSLIGREADEYKGWLKNLLGEETEVEPIKQDDEPVVKEYSVAEVSEMLGMSERSVYRNIQSGKLEAVEREVMIPTIKKFVSASALDAFKAGREVS